MQNKISSIILTALLLMLIAVAGAGAYFLKESGVSAVVGLPMLAVGAVVILLCILAGMSVLYATYNLQDKTQALALPEGSIRAVIALMLIVLFAVLTIYLFGSISEGKFIQISGIAQEQVNEMRATYPTGWVIAVPDGNNTFRVWLRNAPSAEGVDFAKQLLILVGTLVTSISSFYFGAKAVSESSSRQETSAGQQAATSSPEGATSSESSSRQETLPGQQAETGPSEGAASEGERG